MPEEFPITADYPIVLQLTGRLVVIVGAGQVGRRKLRGVLCAGARVRVIDPADSDLTTVPQVEYLQRPFQSGDLAGADLVFICTNDPAINQIIADEAEKFSIWCCRSDQPQSGDFTLPAVLRRDKLTIAVSTGGGSPGMAAQLRDVIAEKIPQSWGKAVEIAAAIRRKWLTEHTEIQYNQEVLHNLLDKELIPLITRKQVEKIDQLLLSQFGPGFSLAELQVQISKEVL